MPHRTPHALSLSLAALALLTTACADEVAAPGPVPAASPVLALSSSYGDDRSRAFDFAPLMASAVCGSRAAPAFFEKPFALPPGYEQVAFARELDGGTRDLWDMHTQNETGPRVGRYLYRTHETGAAGQVSVTDLETLESVGPAVTSETRILAERADWERLDGIAWTPWGTILAAEEVVTSAIADPQVPQAQSGLVYELFVSRSDPTRLDPSRETIHDRAGVDVDGDGTIDLVKDGIRARPAVGARSHEGLRFDPAGNLYGISETSPGYIYKFVPDRRGDLGRGQLHALRVDVPTADRTGQATWVALDRAAVQVNSQTAAAAAGATGYGRPEDVETAASTGTYDPWILFVAITSENRVLGIDLRPGKGKHGDDDDNDGGDHGRRGGADNRAYVFDYVRAGVNAPADFTAPDNLALDKAGNLYIAEDPSGNPVGADIWAAYPGRGVHSAARQTVRFASLSDCAAEPTGIYFDARRSILYVHVQHRGAPDTRDLSIMIFAQDRDDDGDHDDE